eukprot:TRINITY_DN1015_c0_g1_i1.p1 TRINITY_DN1015_c0_g1~~TRINITY_DN1015_c0_g1_i1.p1  ORF type:complete len:345 (-),score=93.38 TRINITY_DN1015_c0_g1_i1:80-1114(-)
MSNNTNTKLVEKLNSMVDLISQRNGGYVLGTSDEFFAEASNLLKPGRGIFIPDKYTDRGKWMDGWESKRHNQSFDWCVIRLGLTGSIHGLTIDTNHFTGNYAQYGRLEALCDDSNPSLEELLKSNEWTEVLPKSKFNGGSEHFYEVKPTKRVTHIKFYIFPDGGVARLRVHGLVEPFWKLYKPNDVIDLALVNNGGRAVACSDSYFCSPHHLLIEGRGLSMGDGWETKRSRVPNHNDWVVIKLGAPVSHFVRCVVDTFHYKGNYPKFCLIEAASVKDDPQDFKDVKWVTILEKKPLTAHNAHYFFLESPQTDTPYTHVRLTIYPDGGVSRLRIFGVRGGVVSKI